MQSKKSYYGRPKRHNNGGRRPNNQQRRGPKKQTIHPSKFVNKAVKKLEVKPYEPQHAFVDFDVADQIKANVKHAGFIHPSAIQDQTIPIALTGKDVIGLANTGTGKTAAFLLPILQKLHKKPIRNSVLIMAPTRELAQQINEEFRKFSYDMRLYSTVVVGGVNIDRQIRELRRNPHVIIGTPGRLKDLLSRKALSLQSVHTFVLDEADRMCDMGFVHDIRHVASLLPTDRQTLCFSATMEPAVQAIIHDFMTSPEVVSVRTGVTSDHVEQDIVEAHDKVHKIELLEAMLKKDEFEKVMVFGETKYGVQRLAEKLTQLGVPSEAIHGNKSQSQRQRALKAFHRGDVKVLVATDVAARGLDINDVSHVINFDQPNSYDDYVHRIGRTGRGGKSGKAFTFVAPLHHR